MKILHVVRQYEPAVGGMEIYVKDMISHQMKMGYDCEVLTLDKVFQSNGQSLPHNEVIDDVKIHRVNFKGKRTYFFPFVSPSFFKNFDIVHVHNTDVFFDYVGLVCRILKIPAFATTHGGFFHTQNFAAIKKFYFNTITRFSSSHYKAIFASSTNDYDLFKNKSKNLLLTPNAIMPLGDFTAAGEDFIYIGRLAHHKYVDRIIQVFNTIIKKHEIKGNLHIVGPEWDVTRKSLQSQVDNFGITDRVNIHGFVNQNEMQAILKQCGYFVSASSFEGFGMSMLEGMSVGLIPLVHPNGSFKDLIKQGNIGTCIDYTNPEKAADDIKTELESVTVIDREKARQFAAQFSWEELAAKTVEAYNQY